MSIVVLGVNHRSAPLDVIERVAVAEESLTKALHSLASRDNVRETVLLSTCNRTEVYVVAEKFHGAYADVRDYFCELSGLTPDELHPHFYSQHDEAAVSHLFEVASGLDSAVIGETEILGQVRDAWDLARIEQTSRTTLNMLFRQALEVGKRARNETGISKSTTSISHAAVEMAKELLGTMQGRSVLVVGAGDMGAGIARALSSAGSASVTVMNRNTERAEQLAATVGAVVSPISELASALGVADVVLTCTGATEPIITAELVRSVRGETPNPLLIVDIAMPRDVEHSVSEIANVTLRDLYDLRDWAQVGINARNNEADAVRTIIVEEVERFTQESIARQAAPLVAELHERAENIRLAEMERFAARMSGLTPEQRDLVETMSKAVVAKLLHTPSIQLKNSAGTPQGERIAAALRDLFDIE
ncbi:MAG: glutamyl-tRNA reductase [Actinomycetota bacterium]|jgi:glutamyl-tRNA reductase